VIGGTVHREESENLTLKSDQAFEFETTIASLATGDSVLSGRFGSSFKLEFPEDRRPVEAIYIARGAIRPSRYTKEALEKLELSQPTDSIGDPRRFGDVFSRDEQELISGPFYSTLTVGPVFLALIESVRDLFGRPLDD
jgi:hypothetical protein